MIFWIRKTAMILSLTAFFIIFFLGIDFNNLFDSHRAIIALIKAGCGALFFWIIGFVLADVVFKGILEDIDADQNDLIDGGMIQRIQHEKDHIVFDANADADKLKKKKA